MSSPYLTHREKRFLFALRFKKSIKPRFDVRQLCSMGLIRQNGTGHRNCIGEGTLLETYSLTDSGYRYFIQRKEEYFTKKFPVVISLIALIKSFWPEISSLLHFIIETIEQFRS